MTETQPAKDRNEPIEENGGETVQTPRGFSWTVHLAARQNRLKTALTVASILISAVTAFFALNGIFAALVIGFVMTAAVSDYLFPLRCAITSQTASSRSLFSQHVIKWSDVKKVYICGDGVKLSPLARLSRLEAFRGVFLWFPNDAAGRDEVIKTVQAFWNREIGGGTAGKTSPLP